ncbi:MAG: hypothetical protein QOI38_1193 [Sphingomonadales bacterium]|jgi:hypothetical protein|nr:hypothetical protein [Sphingomonadales bacterium]
MSLTKLAAALATVSLAAAPAAARPAPPPAPAPEQAEGSALRGDTNPAYYILPLLIVIALLVAALRGEEEAPTSP